MKDFLSFRKMITPIIIQIIFWLGVAACVVVGLISIFGGGIALLSGHGIFSALPILAGLFGIVIGPIIVRIYCEILILFFRMNDTLTDIKNNLDNRNEKETPL